MKLIVAFILMLLVSSGQAKTLIVDPGGSGDAKTLSAAISLASPGDSIQIWPGKYGGAIVDRSLNISGKGEVVLEGPLAITAPGCEISALEVNASGEDAAVNLMSRDNQLFHCTIAGASIALSSWGENNTIRDNQINSPLGLEIYGAKNRVQNCTVQGNIGIKVNRTSESLITDCRIAALQGVLIEDSRQNVVVNNALSGDGFGVVLTKSEGNNVSGNNLTGAYVSGLDVSDSGGNNLTQNLITGGMVGISLRGAKHCNVTENICSRNERAGVYCSGASQNFIAYNELSKDGNGILLSGSVDNWLQSNNASKNIYGISLRGSSKSVLRNNTLHGNTYNLRVDRGDGTPGASSLDFYVQDIDKSNLADNRSICYLVGKAGLVVPPNCGFLGLISCRDVRAVNLTIYNSSTGILLVNSSNCRIQNSSVYQAEDGIFLLDSEDCIISSCRVRDSKTGFDTSDSTRLQFVNDLARNCTAEGFRADGALNLLLLKCRMETSNSGISLHGSRLCRVQNCSTDLNLKDGMLLTLSQKCSLIGNEAAANDRGISLTGSNACVLDANNARSNTRDGISLEQLSDAEVLDNIATGNGQGIYVQSSKKSRISGNILSENSRYGLRMSSSTGCNITDNNISNNQIAGVNLVDCTSNYLYHNILADNLIQNAADNGQNQWDAGPVVGGNYWSDHMVVGNPGNVPRPIPGKGQDRYPFQDPGGWN